jgi:TolB-like protein/DNA-binding winged helix-turn-helix (wHTH) protein/cytochrome c-type biogenesis protein CcmH/NrfG
MWLNFNHPFCLDLDAARPMNIIVGLHVPNDRRKKDEKSLKPAAGSAFPGGPGGGAPEIGARDRLMRFASFTLDMEGGRLLAGDEEVPLRPKTFAFLCYLVTNPGRLISKDELLGALWPNVVVTEDSVVQCVTELRRALDDHEQRLIKTMRRRGYRFDAPVSIDPRPDAAPTSDLPAVVDPNDALGRRGRMAAAIGALFLTAAAVAAIGWWSMSRDAVVTAAPLSIVVLPFANLGDDPGQDYLAEGVSNDLTAALSRLPGTFVIASATARTFKGRTADARQIGRELHVRYLLEGSLNRAGDRVRINVELVDATTAASVWAERFERRRDQIAAWQDEVIGRMANALNYRLTRLESERALREHRDDPGTSDLTMRGWSLVYAAKNPGNYGSARALFRQALDRDPRAVNALAGIAWTSAVMVLDGWSTDRSADFAAAESATGRALAIDPNHVVALHVRGFLFRLQRRSAAARDVFRTVVALNPNFAPGYAQLGAAELELGHPDAAISAAQHAIRLSPRDPALGPWLATVGMAELHLGRDREAISWLTRAIDTGTPIARHHAYLAGALALAGQLSEARVVLAALRDAQPSATISGLRTSAKSTEAGFLTQQERVFDGLRIAGLPE